MSKTIRLTHSDVCKRLGDKLEAVKWCTGNGACGYTDCHCDKLRVRWSIEHNNCIKRHAAQLRICAEKTAGDGKSRAAGERE